MIQRNTDIAFAHAVRYRDAMISSWAKRTGHADAQGWVSYHPSELPGHYEVPTNEERSRAEVIEFKLKPLQRGEPYSAYLSHIEGPDLSPNTYRITTWTGETLAVVTAMKSRRVRNSSLTDTRGTFKAKGIDGRTYYGTHNGTGMYCRMRLKSK